MRYLLFELFACLSLGLFLVPHVSALPLQKLAAKANLNLKAGVEAKAESKSQSSGYSSGYFFCGYVQSELGNKGTFIYAQETDDTPTVSSSSFAVSCDYAGSATSDTAIIILNNPSSGYFAEVAPSKLYCVDENNAVTAPTVAKSSSALSYNTINGLSANFNSKSTKLSSTIPQGADSTSYNAYIWQVSCTAANSVLSSSVAITTYAYSPLS